MNYKLSKRILIGVLAFSLALSPSFVSLAEDESAGDPVIVSDGEELNAALSGFSGNGSLVISLANDIDAVTSATYTKYTNGASITINGNGHKIEGGGVAGTGLRFGARGQALSLTVIDTIFSNLKNSDRQGGGAIGLWSGALDVSGSTFVGNSATAGVGGAIRHQGGASTSITNSKFTGNSSSGAGGALNIGAPGAITNVYVVGNKAGAAGGGIAVPDGRNGAAPAAVILSGSIVADNSPDNTRNVIDGNDNTYTLTSSINIIRSESNAISADFEVVNASEFNNLAAVGILAVYDEQGALTSIATKPIQATPAGKEKANITIPFGKYQVKAFIWTDGTYIPICEPSVQDFR